MRKYLKNGEEVEVLQWNIPVDGKLGCLVRKVLNAYDSEEEILSEPFYTELAYDKAPTQKLDNRILALDANIKSLTERYKTLQAEVCKMEHQVRDSKFKYQKYDCLKYLDAYIEGKITHIVKIGYGYAQILDFIELKEKAIKEDKNSSNWGLRILSLFATSNTNEYKWRIHQYSDGSGSNYDCIICLSYDEAKSILKEVIDMQSSYNSMLIDEANKHGIELDCNKLKEYYLAHEKCYYSNIEKAKKDICDAECKIREYSKKLIELENR